MKSGLRSAWLWPLILAVAFFLIPTLLNHAYPASFWAVTDYETLGLADALNMAYRLADLQQYKAAGLTNHPGVPFYFLSWIALALTGYPVASGEANFFRTVIDHVEDYHRMIMPLGALVGAFGVYLFAWAVRNRVPVGVTLASVLIWLVSTPATLMMFMSVSIDSFAIVINALFVAVLIPLAYDDDIDPSILVFAGFVGAFAYLNKLSYVYVPVALLAAMVMKMFLSKASRLQVGRSLAVYSGSLLLFLFAVIFLVIGWEGARELYVFQRGVILGSGLYGEGARTVVSASEVWRAIASIPGDRAYAVPIALIGGAALALGGLIAGCRRRERTAVAVMSVGSGSAAMLSALFVIKHYDLHYTAGVSATLPACVASAYLLGEPWLFRFRWWAAGAAAAVLALMAVQVQRPIIDNLASAVSRSALAKADLDEINAYWAGHNRTIEFVYRSPFAECGEGFVVAFGSVPRMIHDYLRSRPHTIASMAGAMVSRDVGAYVLDKAYFPTVESIKTAPNIALLDPNPNPVKFKDGDKLIELRTVFLLIRS